MKNLTWTTKQMLASAVITGLAAASSVLKAPNLTKTVLAILPMAGLMAGHCLIAAEAQNPPPRSASSNAVPAFMNSGSGGPNALVPRSSQPGMRANRGTNASASNPGHRLNREAIQGAARAKMAKDQLTGRGVAKSEILQAMGKVPRHNFVPAMQLAEAYADKSIDLGGGRVLAPAFQVASVIEQADIKPTDRVLELGGASGYQTAVLSLLAKEVYAVESLPFFASSTTVNLQRLGYTNNVFVRTGPLTNGWPEAAPFDAIIVNAGLEQAGAALAAQLKEGARLVLPVTQEGNLAVLRKTGGVLSPIASRSIRTTQLSSDNTVPAESVPAALVRKQK